MTAVQPHVRQRPGGAPSQPRPRVVRRALHGVLLLDKPLGWTSNDALQKAKGLLRAEKAGHTGTLDPLATGLLPLCFGAATKFSQVSLDADKRYRATLRLGQTTASADAESPVLQVRAVVADREAVAAACQRLTGDIDQLPPMHSALKHEGKALYEYARAGIEIERAPRRVRIHAIDIVDWQHEVLVIDVTCSKGTYIRTLAQDLGELLGCGAHLSALRRTACGPLLLQQAITLDALVAMSETEREARLLPADVLVSAWPEVRLPHDEAGRFLCGLRRRVTLADQPQVRVYGPAPAATDGASFALPAVASINPPVFDRAFLGTAHITAGELIADRLLSPLEVQVTP